MVFSSPIFLFLYLPIVLCVYYIIRPNLRNLWLFISSFFFYAWGRLDFAILILFSTLINYVIGLSIHKNDNSKRKKTILIIGIIYNIGILVFFKYFNFLAENIILIIKNFNGEIYMPLPVVPLPIGISFFTFQIMSYIIDVYRKNTDPQKNFVDLGLYIMLFPQLIAGPIVRYIDIEKQIVDREISLIRYKDGLQRFIIGLAKKAIFANPMGFIADYAFNNPLQLNTITAWTGILCYALQIYFDFSAYSDMAIGIGKILGFDFLENFNYPYISRSIKEFWRRWHISLSSWFRDYVYIPLGGSRKGEVKTYRNLFIIFFLTGLWHGAAWNFIIWGLFHGFFLIIERAGFDKIITKLPKILQHIYTLFIVLIGWVFFRAVDLNFAFRYIKYLLIFDLDGWQTILKVIDIEYIVTFVLAIIFSTPATGYIRNKIDSRFNKGTKKNVQLQLMSDVVIFIVFLVSVCYVVGAKFNPFIYFIF